MEFSEKGYPTPAYLTAADLVRLDCNRVQGFQHLLDLTLDSIMGLAVAIKHLALCGLILEDIVLHRRANLNVLAMS